MTRAFAMIPTSDHAWDDVIHPKRVSAFQRPPRCETCHGPTVYRRDESGRLTVHCEACVQITAAREAARVLGNPNPSTVVLAFRAPRRSSLRRPDLYSAARQRFEAMSDDELLRRYQFESGSTIAKSFPVHHNVVNQRLQRLGVDLRTSGARPPMAAAPARAVRPPRDPRPSKQRDVLLVVLNAGAQGLTVLEIADRLGEALSAVAPRVSELVKRKRLRRVGDGRLAGQRARYVLAPDAVSSPLPGTSAGQVHGTAAAQHGREA